MNIYVQLIVFIHSVYMAVGRWPLYCNKIHNNHPKWLTDSQTYILQVFNTFLAFDLNIDNIVFAVSNNHSYISSS